MPQNKDMKLQWQTINDELVPFTLPQHWDGNDWSITGTDNPLPTGNHVMTEGGVWIPQRGSDDGAVNTQVIGSIVQQDYLHETTIPQGSSVDVPIENFKSKRISVGILFIDISRFSFRTISRGANESRYLDSITHDSEEGRRNISQLELRTKITTVRVQNEDDKDIEIDYLTITEFVGEA